MTVAVRWLEYAARRQVRTPADSAASCTPMSDGAAGAGGQAGGQLGTRAGRPGRRTGQRRRPPRRRSGRRRSGPGGAHGVRRRRTSRTGAAPAARSPRARVRVEHVGNGFDRRGLPVPQPVAQEGAERPAPASRRPGRWRRGRPRHEVSAQPSQLPQVGAQVELVQRARLLPGRRAGDQLARTAALDGLQSGERPARRLPGPRYLSPRPSARRPVCRGRRAGP